MSSDELPHADVAIVNQEAATDGEIQTAISTVKNAVAHMLPKTDSESHGQSVRHIHDFDGHETDLSWMNVDPARKADVHSRVHINEPLELTNTKQLHSLHHLQDAEPTLYSFEPKLEDSEYDVLVSIGFTAQTIKHIVDIFMITGGEE